MPSSDNYYYIDDAVPAKNTDTEYEEDYQRDFEKLSHNVTKLTAMGDVPVKIKDYSKKGFLRNYFKHYPEVHIFAIIDNVSIDILNYDHIYFKMSMLLLIITKK